MTSKVKEAINEFDESYYRWLKKRVATLIEQDVTHVTRQQRFLIEQLERENAWRANEKR